MRSLLHAELARCRAELRAMAQRSELDDMKRNVCHRILELIVGKLGDVRSRFQVRDFKLTETAAAGAEVEWVVIIDTTLPTEQEKMIRVSVRGRCSGDAALIHFMIPTANALNYTGRFNVLKNGTISDEYFYFTFPRAVQILVGESWA